MEIDKESYKRQTETLRSKVGDTHKAEEEMLQLRLRRLMSEIYG